jgi:hypothetical protein
MGPQVIASQEIGRPDWGQERENHPVFPVSVAMQRLTELRFPGTAAVCGKKWIVRTMRNLPTNDVGILAPSIVALYRPVEEQGALPWPLRRRSRPGVGHGVSMLTPMAARRVQVKNVYGGQPAGGERKLGNRNRRRRARHARVSQPAATVRSSLGDPPRHGKRPIHSRAGQT